MSDRVTIRLRLYGYLGEAGADREHLLSVSPTLAQAWDDILGELDGLEEKLRRVSFLVVINGVSKSHSACRDVQLAEGDVVDLVPTVAGGLAIT